MNDTISIREVTDTNNNEMSGGIWYNKVTGLSVRVQDPIMDGDKMYIMTSDGVMLDMDYFSNNFVLMSEDLYDEKGNVTGKQVIDGTDFKSNTTKQSNRNLLLNNYSLDTPLTTLQPSTSSNSIRETKLKDTKTEIIEKIISKNPPTCELILKWDRLPIMEFKMLKDYFDITEEDIKQFLHKTTITYDSLDEEIHKIFEEVSAETENE